MIDSADGKIEAHVTAEYPMSPELRAALEALAAAAVKMIGDK